jgi:hypothetical protein
MCELCENIGNPNKLVWNRRIVKYNDNTYGLEVWTPANKNEIDSKYTLLTSIEITECPDCNGLLK